MTENEMLEWHHWLHGHEFEQAPGVGDGQGSLAYYRPRGHKESDMTEQQQQQQQQIILKAHFQNNKNNMIFFTFL